MSHHATGSVRSACVLDGVTGTLIFHVWKRTPLSHTRIVYCQMYNQKFTGFICMIDMCIESSRKLHKRPLKCSLNINWAMQGWCSPVLNFNQNLLAGWGMWIYFQKMALETKEKRLITELAAAPSQTTSVHVSMYMHAQMRIPDTTAGGKWDRMFLGWGFSQFAAPPLK